MRFLLFCFAFCLLALRLDAAEPVAPPSSTSDLMGEVLPILQGNYVDFAGLQYQKGDHLADLIDRSKGELTLESASYGKSMDGFPVTATLLPGNVIYLRLATFTPSKEGWAPLLTQLQEWQRQNITGMIFDVRENATSNDYAGVRDLANLVMPAHTLILNTQGGPHPAGESDKKDYSTAPTGPVYQGPVVVLVDGRTTGAGEALTAYLRKYRGALVIGQPTTGHVAVFGWQQLSSGPVLRYAVGHVFLPDGTDLWNRPIVPDIQIAVSNQNEKAALMLIERNRIGEVIEESTERRRLNEAALVQGEDPEWDDYLGSLRQRPVLLSLPIIHDKILLTALDSLKAIQVSQRQAVDSAATTSSPAATASRQ